MADNKYDTAHGGTRPGGYTGGKMMSRREAMMAPAAAALYDPAFELCMHQTTSAAAGYRKSLEGYAKAGFRLVEVIPPHVDEFVKKEGVGAANRLLADLGLRAVSSGGVRGLAEPGPHRPKALEELKRRCELLAEMKIDRMVCPCVTTEKYTAEDYPKGIENLREAGEVARPFGVTAMFEFSRGSTFAGSLATALRLTRGAAHPNVKPMFDFYHFWAGLSKFEDFEAVAPGEIHHVHFQDVPDIPRELLDGTTREVPGEGIAPLAKTLHMLRAKGYTGPLSVELFYPRFQNGDAYEVARHIRERSEAVLRKAGLR
jgi:2-keto-myo-inositol isomerase